MQEILAALISFVLLDPLKAELTDQLSAAGAPQAVAIEVTTCARDSAPLIVERAASDPWWAVSSTVGIWTGTHPPDAILIEVAPACAAAAKTARAYIAGEEV